MPTLFYDIENRIKNDACLAAQRDIDNRRFVDYHMTNMRGDPCQPCGSTDNNQLDEFMFEHPNLRPWKGYGISCAVLNSDSHLRYDPSKQSRPPKTPQQLENRLFQAVPLLQRGIVLPSLESRILSGMDTSQHHRTCDPISEYAFDTFHPQLNNVVEPTGCRIGNASSRDISRSKEFLQSCGYVYDGKAWYRKQS